ncbi:MAG: Rps23 Pro-64 3,4-dihydroxylase Tpa1-like proline 4-hydroxylase [Granulosicoccus sp.]|jgi:Rps23 Pro-64 3,4-dihydroxylase Tpa1-like proline 4-hydroxylase
MWLNNELVIGSAVEEYRKFLLGTCPNYIVIDGLFDEAKLDEVMSVLQQPHHWQTQQHTYSSLYVDSVQWQNSSKAQRFVQRDVWQRDVVNANDIHNIAQKFLSYLRGDEFMSVLSRIFNVQLTDVNVSDPEINTNYFRLAPTDFVEQHADDSPGREVCMLLYLNQDWSNKAGGELGFAGENVGKGVDKVTGKRAGKKNSQPITIAPLYNRCVLFDPSSEGSEHWVEKLHAEYADQYRYNVTSWYWGE